MQLEHNGIVLIVPDHEVVRLALDRLNGRAAVEPAAPVPSLSTPHLGDVWSGQGGVYAGVVRGRDGEADYHLIVGPEYDGTLGWDDSAAWAKGLHVSGHNDFTLGARNAQSIAYGNVPELFKREGYWSQEQHASDSSDAWYQNFSYGRQDNWFKRSRFRARAFRRLPI